MYWLISIALLVFAAQCLMLVDRSVSWAHRLHDLGYGGDSWFILMALALLGGAVGCGVGGITGGADPAVWIGGCLAIVVWFGMVLATSSSRRPRPTELPAHRKDDAT